MPSSNPRMADRSNPQSAFVQKQSWLQSTGLRNIYWLPPTAATILFLISIAVAIGHHYYHSSLHHSIVSDQEWISRYSLVFAFVVKATLTGAMSIAFSQLVWYSIRRNKAGVSVEGIDALLAVENSLVPFAYFDMWRSAFPAAVTAAFIWLFPLIAVISPTSLSVGVLTSETFIDCTVPALNFSNGAHERLTADFRNENPIAAVRPYLGFGFNTSLPAQKSVEQTTRNGDHATW